MICTAAGAVSSLVLKRRCVQLRALSSLLDEMSSKIRYQSVRMSCLIAETAAESAYSGCPFVRRVTENISSGMQINDAWISAAETAPFLAAADRDILKNIGSQLGGSDTDGQLSMLTLGGTMLSRSLEDAEREQAVSSRMLLSVWTMCGIGAGILIL